MNSPVAIAQNIVAPHKPVDFHVPHPSSVLRYSPTTTTTSHSLKSSLPFSPNQRHSLLFFSQSSPLLLNSSDDSDTDEGEGEEEGLGDGDDRIDASDDDSDTEIDYLCSPFGRPPSRLGRRVPPAARKQNSGNKRHKPHISIERLKVDNSFLKSQNLKLSLELEHSRSTIQALKNIVNQKDLDLQNIRKENQNAALRIRILEALIMSKHAKDGSIIVRSGGGGGGKDNNGDVIVVNGLDDNMKESAKSTSTWNNKESPSPLKQQQKASRQKQKKSSSRSTPDISQQPSPKPPTKDLLSPLQYSPSQTTLPPVNQQKLSSPPPPSPKRQKHQRRWSMDFGPHNSLSADDGSLDDQDTESASSNRHSVSPASSSTIYVSGRRSVSSSRNVPQLIKRKTGDIIQSLASCRPTSTKNGYDFSPPGTPTLVRSETSDSEDGDQEEEEECEDIEEKLQKQRKLGKRLFNRIFSSSSSSSSTTAAARGPLSC